LRNRLWERLNGELPGVELVGPALDAVDDAGKPLRLPHNLNVSFGDVEGEAILLRTPGVAASSGAACSSSDPAPSHVLAALGLDEGRTRSSLRLGLGRFNAAEEIEQAADALVVAVRELRTLL
jgi:cysteine desulfurase